MGTMIWQRRRRFARMKVQGYSTRVLWHALFCESALLLGTGCLDWARVFGIYGQLLLSHALLSVTGFPVVYSAGVLAALGSFALVTAVAAAIVAVPGYREPRGSVSVAQRLAVEGRSQTVVWGRYRSVGGCSSRGYRQSSQSSRLGKYPTLTKDRSGTARLQTSLGASGAGARELLWGLRGGLARDARLAARAR